MSEDTSITYNKGDVVWVKLGSSCWWPGEVISLNDLPEGVELSYRKVPLAIVEFFEEQEL